jgi:hypothetical protein
MEKPRRGRPPKAESDLHSEQFLIKLEAAERQAFEDAAELAGERISYWARERLRRSASRELRRASRRVAFLDK